MAGINRINVFECHAKLSFHFLSYSMYFVCHDKPNFHRHLRKNISRVRKYLIAFLLLYIIENLAGKSKTSNGRTNSLSYASSGQRI
jgi:hypothetical protein